MKKALAILSTMFLVCANLLAVSVGDTANYVKNSSRTAWLIKDAGGSLKVIEHRTSGDWGPGYVVNLKYHLNVLIRGEQTGDMDIFIPEHVFAHGFYDSAENTVSLGAFKLSYLGQSSGKDSNGREYNCSMANISDVDHNFAGANNQAKVIRFDHSGSIDYVTDLNIKFRAHPDVPVIGAVEMDVSGVSSNGIGFYAGLDLAP